MGQGTTRTCGRAVPGRTRNARQRPLGFVPRKWDLLKVFEQGGTFVELWDC